MSLIKNIIFIAIKITFKNCFHNVTDHFAVDKKKKKKKAMSAAQVQTCMF